MNLTDLSLDQPLPIQLSQVGNYVVINDPAYPPLSCTVVNGYDAFGNAISSVQVFPRTVKLVRSAADLTVDESIPNPIQLSQVTNYVPLFNDDATFPALSTIVVNGYDAFGNAISAVQQFPRTISLVNEVGTVDPTQPSPIQLSQVANYTQVTDGIQALSCTVVNGYDAFGNAISSVQVFPRQVSLTKEITTLNWNTTAANPIQFLQVTNYVNLLNDDATFPALSTTVVNGYDAFGNAISSVQVFPRTASLVHTVDPGITLDYNAPLPIQLAQIGNYVPLYNNDATYPALTATVVNGYDAFGNAISAYQLFPRMVSLIYNYGSEIFSLYFSPTTTSTVDWSTNNDFSSPFVDVRLSAFSAVPISSVKALSIYPLSYPGDTTQILNLSSYTNLEWMVFDSLPYAAVDTAITQGFPDSITKLELYTCSLPNDFGDNHHEELHKVNDLLIWNDLQMTYLDVSHLSAMQSLALYNTAVTAVNFTNDIGMTSISFNYNNYLLSLNLSPLTALRVLDIQNAPLLTSLNLNNVTDLRELYLHYTGLSGALELQNNLLLDYYDASFNSFTAINIAVPNSVSYINFYDNNLTQQSVDNILQICATSAASAVSSMLYLDGGTNATPSLTALTYLWTLTANNWTVTIN